MSNFWISRTPQVKPNESQVICWQGNMIKLVYNMDKWQWPSARNYAFTKECRSKACVVKNNLSYCILLQSLKRQHLIVKPWKKIIWNSNMDNLCWIVFLGLNFVGMCKLLSLMTSKACQVAAHNEAKIQMVAWVLELRSQPNASFLRLKIHCALCPSLSVYVSICKSHEIWQFARRG